MRPEEFNRPKAARAAGKVLLGLRGLLDEASKGRAANKIGVDLLDLDVQEVYAGYAILLSMVGKSLPAKADVDWRLEALLKEAAGDAAAN